MTGRPPIFAVVGGASCTPETGQLAYDVGLEVADRGGILLCGGRQGVMERAAAGARQGGAQTVGILPGRSTTDSPPNESIQLPIFTGLGQARNLVLVLSADAVIAVGGGWGTLSEISLAIKHDVPVVLLESWDALRPATEDEPLLETASTAAEAVDRAAAAAGRRVP